MDAWRKGGRKEGMGVHCMVEVRMGRKEWKCWKWDVGSVMVEVRCWWWVNWDVRRDGGSLRPVLIRRRSGVRREWEGSEKGVRRWWEGRK
jgi:hypothetical protein